MDDEALEARAPFVPEAPPLPLAATVSDARREYLADSSELGLKPLRDALSSLPRAHRLSHREEEEAHRELEGDHLLGLPRDAYTRSRAAKRAPRAEAPAVATESAVTSLREAAGPFRPPVNQRARLFSLGAAPAIAGRAGKPRANKGAMSLAKERLARAWAEAPAPPARPARARDVEAATRRRRNEGAAWLSTKARPRRTDERKPDAIALAEAAEARAASARPGTAALPDAPAALGALPAAPSASSALPAAPAASSALPAAPAARPPLWVTFSDKDELNASPRADELETAGA